MSLFGKTEDPVAQEIIERIETLSKAVAKLRGERDATKESLKLSDDIVELKKRLTNTQIEYDREKEKHEREKREVEHMVGLERKRQEFEVTSAKRDVQLTVREENLKEDRRRFEEEMDYTRKRFGEEIGRLDGLMKDILKRLPEVKVEKSIDLQMPNGNGNGKHEPVEA